MGGVKALPAILSEAPPHHAHERRREYRRREFGRIRLEDRVHRFHGRRAGKRPSSGQHLVQHGAERENVGARIDGQPPHLFRRHVADGSDDDARARDRLEARHLCFDRHLLPGEAEIENLQPRVAREEEVVGLDVAMDDALFVRRGQAGGRLPREVDRFRRRQRTLAEPRRERFALEELGDDVRAPVVRADVEHSDDIGVVEPADGLSFSGESPKTIFVRSEGGGEDLQRHVATEPGIARAIDFAHTAGADESHDLVRSDIKTRRERH